MDERDAEEVLGMLTAQGDELAGTPEAADAILLDTCSVRSQRVEQLVRRLLQQP